MNRRAIIIWGIVGIIAVIGIILTYILLRNNGSSDTKQVDQDNIDNNISTDSTDNNQNKDTIIDTNNVENNSKQGSGDIIPISLLSKLKIDTRSTNGKYYYSLLYKIAFSYEAIAIGESKNIIVTEEDYTSNIKKVYIWTEGSTKELGQSIEIINIDSDKRFNTIPDIIATQLLTPIQNTNCQVIEKDGKYSVIAKDTKVTDSTAICGKYAKGNNRFFIKPQEEGTATNKLVFVTAGDRELSYDGSNNGKFWYQSVVVE